VLSRTGRRHNQLESGESQRAISKLNSITPNNISNAAEGGEYDIWDFYDFHYFATLLTGIAQGIADGTAEVPP
jgi:hypothetical protein